MDLIDFSLRSLEFKNLELIGFLVIECSYEYTIEL